MHSIGGLFAVAIISLVVISQHDVFGASFYDDEFDFERRVPPAKEITKEEKAAAIAILKDGLAQLKKGLPVCLALPDASFRAVLKKHFAENPSEAGRRKRSADLMGLFEDDLAQELLSFERRSKDADEKAVVDDLGKLIERMNSKEQTLFVERITEFQDGTVDGIKEFMDYLIDLTEQCAKAKKSPRSFALREFLESELMNEDY